MPTQAEINAARRAQVAGRAIGGAAKDFAGIGAIGLDTVSWPMNRAIQFGTNAARAIAGRNPVVFEQMPALSVYDWLRGGAAPQLVQEVSIEDGATGSTGYNPFSDPQMPAATVPVTHTPAVSGGR